MDVQEIARRLEMADHRFRALHRRQPDPYQTVQIEHEARAVAAYLHGYPGLRLRVWEHPNNWLHAIRYIEVSDGVERVQLRTDALCDGWYTVGQILGELQRHAAITSTGFTPPY